MIKEAHTKANAAKHRWATRFDVPAPGKKDTTVHDLPYSTFKQYLVSGEKEKARQRYQARNGTPEDPAENGAKTAKGMCRRLRRPPPPPVQESKKGRKGKAPKANASLDSNATHPGSDAAIRSSSSTTARPSSPCMHATHGTPHTTHHTPHITDCTLHLTHKANIPPWLGVSSVLIALHHMKTSCIIKVFHRTPCITHKELCVNRISPFLFD